MQLSTPVSRTTRFPAWLRLLTRILTALVLIALIVSGGVCLWFRSASRSALPMLDGSLALSGLHAPVSVVRDEHGVPTITAQNLDDLFFAQGYVTAQDRMW